MDASRDTVTGDVQLAVTNLRATLDTWTIRSLAELITVEHSGDVRGGIDVRPIGDVMMTLDRDLDDLAVKIDAIQLLMTFISSPSS